MQSSRSWQWANFPPQHYFNEYGVISFRQYGQNVKFLIISSNSVAHQYSGFVNAVIEVQSVLEKKPEHDVPVTGIRLQRRNSTFITRWT